MLKRFFAVCSLFLFAACSEAQSVSLGGKEFKMLNAPENADITIGFAADEPRFYGAAPVNRYMGSYELKGTDIRFVNPASTMMMGPEELMLAERDYLAFLEKVKTVQLQGTKLILGTGDKTAEFEEIGK